MKFTKAETAAIASAPFTEAEVGMKYICVGPFCYGFGTTPGEAIKNAKKNRIRIYEGQQGWRFMMFYAETNVSIDGMGGFNWTPEDCKNPNKPYVEFYRSTNRPDVRAVEAMESKS